MISNLTTEAQYYLQNIIFLLRYLLLSSTKTLKLIKGNVLFREFHRISKNY